MNRRKKSRPPEPPDTSGMSSRSARNAWVRQLRTHCKIDRPVVVQWTPEPPEADGEEVNGWCLLVEDVPDRPYYVVTIWSQLPREFQRELLCHEWAHAMAWGQDPEDEDHGHRWGLAYRRCYQAVIAH